MTITSDLNGQPEMDTAMNIDSPNAPPPQSNRSLQSEPTCRARAQTEPYQPLPQYTVGYVYSSEMLLHSSLTGHPEQPERISRIRKAIQNEELLDKMKQIRIRPVYREEALLVHTQEHWDKVLAIQCEYGLDYSQLATRINLLIGGSVPQL